MRIFILINKAVMKLAPPNLQTGYICEAINNLNEYNQRMILRMAARLVPPYNYLYGLDDRVMCSENQMHSNAQPIGEEQ
jgi:hypothetical protein